ncbi:uncharacterized protein LOC127546971 [Antechinus flavipes]|uniref:uncharacterized protein LOC127546971 n=1 Tax=Antechinus flavipes TaxID=38775 RepID=UPI002235602D|nr:uncharacterized protein LOC127546971 [Antechinus flavipes]
MSSQGSWDGAHGGLLQGLAKGPSFLGRLQCRPRARSMELPGSPPKGPLRATSEFLDSGTSSFLGQPHSPRPLARSPSPSLPRDIHPTGPGPLSWDLFGKSSDRLLGRRTSLPHLLDWAGSGLPGRPLALQSWSRSERDVRLSSPDGVPRREELVGQLPSARGTPRERAQETQRREKALELSQMKCELLDLRQKLRSFPQSESQRSPPASPSSDSAGAVAREVQEGVRALWRQLFVFLQAREAEGGGFPHVLRVLGSGAQPWKVPFSGSRPPSPGPEVPAAELQRLGLGLMLTGLRSSHSPVSKVTLRMAPRPHPRDGGSTCR